MRIAQFNALPRQRAAAMVATCAGIPRWVDAIVAHRPYPSVDRLIEFAEHASLCWTASEVARALEQSPITREQRAMHGAPERPADSPVPGAAALAPAHEVRALALHHLDWLFAE
ncbi:2-oxo-4-hydroxy-4-carboxy-5-ureidoimidazoline decarboxylase [Lolliginicoccus suaedae]|uniref:2-oxo-4-hydroxy-4-carboxy-5-ureidoimidazoline decarboxylase n=1 Tax=Lolliginicoccus suaedae TaxID=2605429 RepID=UPI0016597CFC|nr:2-oxo-4-hydroxy-4-carboxy-5-ureidoimidazoline decarboxylase [Lolliginicoccus suaedae]